MMSVWAGFAIGLLGSLHCVGMCGPLVLAIPLTKKDRFFIIVNSVVYNFFRVITYTIMGFVIGALGWTAKLGGIQKIVSILLGIALLYTAISYYIPLLNASLWESTKIKIGTKVTQYIGESLKIKSKGNSIRLGMLNGLIPCGLVYIALASSVTLGHPLRGAFYMFLFGVGTMPLMVLIMATGNMYKGVTAKLRKLIPVFIALLGIYLIFRGLGVSDPMTISH